MGLPKTILFLITGPIASGKGAVKYFLVDKGFEYIRFTDPIIDEMNVKKLNTDDRKDWVKVLVNMRKEKGKTILAEIAEKKIVEGGKYVIDPVRYPEDIQYLKEKYGAFVFYIDSPFDVRYKRAYYRDFNLTETEFKKRDDDEFNPQGSDSELKPNISKCKELADYVIENDGDLNKLNEAIEDILSKLNIPIQQDEFYTEGVDM